jgi:hypothetical protein
VVAAFFYFMFLGAGLALGIGLIALAAYKLWPRIQGKSNKRKNKGVSF